MSVVGGRGELSVREKRGHEFLNGMKGRKGKWRGESKQSKRGRRVCVIVSFIYVVLVCVLCVKGREKGEAEREFIYILSEKERDLFCLDRKGLVPSCLCLAHALCLHGTIIIIINYITKENKNKN